MSITADQVYLLNNKMGRVANSVQLGTLIQQAESVVSSEVSLASGKILIGNGSNVAAEQTVSGDVTISTAGVTAISAGVIVNADVNASAAIAFSKLAALPSAQILVGDGSNVAAAVAMSGDITISNLGVTAIGADKVLNANIADAQVSVEHLDSGIAPSHVVKYAGTINTIAAASQSLAVVGVLATDVVMLTFKTNVNSVSLLTAAANVDAIDVVFSGDPGVSAVYYQVLRAAV